MKRFFTIVAALSSVLFLAACTDKTPTDDENEMVELETPYYRQYVKDIVFEETPTLAMNKKDAFVKEIAFLESGKAFIAYEFKDQPEEHFEICDYKVVNDIYEIPFLGAKFELATKASMSVVLTYNGNTKSFAANINPSLIPLINLYMANLCRGWKVSSTDITVSGGDLKGNVGKRFDGCDINKLADYAVSQKVKFDTSKLGTGLSVKSITFSELGKLVFEFSGHEPYAAKWSGSGTSISLGSWITDMGADFFKNATLTGTFKGKKLVVAFETDVKAGSSTYRTKVELNLEELK